MNIRIGITFGCFIPLHRGHMDMIHKAIVNHDMTIIGVTGHDFDRGKDFIPFMRRVELMRQIYGNRDSSISVATVDDKAIGLTGTFSQDAWRTWCCELFRQENLDPDEPRFEYTWYIGDQDYIDKIKNLYPHHKFVKLDRSVIPVSGTEIREDYKAHQADIHPVFYDYLVKNHG